MCIRDRFGGAAEKQFFGLILARAGDLPGDAGGLLLAQALGCLLYTSDAADERSSVDLGGRRIIKKKNTKYMCNRCTPHDSTMQHTDTRSEIQTQHDQRTTHRET